MVKKRTHKNKTINQYPILSESCLNDMKKYEMVTDLCNTMIMVLGRLNSEYFGCSLKEIPDHVESIFKENMYWRDYDKLWIISIPTPRREGTNEKMSENEIISNFHYSKIKVTFKSDVKYTWP